MDYHLQFDYDWNNTQISNIYIAHYPTCRRTFIFQAENVFHAENILTDIYDGCECNYPDVKCNPILDKIPEGEVVHNTMVFGGGKDLYVLQLKAVPLKI